MPGYLTPPSSNASGIFIDAIANIDANNVQDAIAELQAEKSELSELNAVDQKATSARTIALLGL